MPGELGGANWGGAAADPETGVLYVRSADQPALHEPMTLVEDSEAVSRMAPQPRYTGRLGSMFFAENGLNAMSPPWAQITAYDLNSGDIKWQAPFGVVPVARRERHHQHRATTIARIGTGLSSRPAA